MLASVEEARGMSEVLGSVRSAIVGLRKVRLAELTKFHGGNPRAMGARMRASLRKSISELGYIEPIIAREVDSGLEVLNGHHRLETLQSAGVDEADVLVVDVKTDAQARLVALALNKIQASWTDDSLVDFLKSTIDASSISSDALAEVTGFSGAELDTLLVPQSDLLPALNDPPREVAPEVEVDPQKRKLTVHFKPDEFDFVMAAIDAAKKKISKPRSIARALIHIIEQHEGSKCPSA